MSYIPSLFIYIFNFEKFLKCPEWAHMYTPASASHSADCKEWHSIPIFAWWKIQEHSANQEVMFWWEQICFCNALFSPFKKQGMKEHRNVHVPLILLCFITLNCRCFFKVECSLLVFKIISELQRFSNTSHCIAGLFPCWAYLILIARMRH